MATVAEVLGGVAEQLDLGAGPSMGQPVEWSAPVATPIATPVAIAERPSQATLTRTIVQQPTWLGKVRSRLWKFAAIAVGEIAVIAVAVSLATMGSSDTASATAAAPAAAMAAEPAACDPPVEPVPEIVIDEPARAARPAPRDKRREEPAKPERRARRDKPEKAAKAEKPKPKPAPPKPKEDPFESISTPAVY
jgi:hypothetical protein